MLKNLMQQANQKKDTIDGEDEGINDLLLNCITTSQKIIILTTILMHSEQLEPLTAEEQEEKEQLLEEVKMKYNSYCHQFSPVFSAC